MAACFVTELVVGYCFGFAAGVPGRTEAVLGPVGCFARKWIEVLERMRRLGVSSLVCVWRLRIEVGMWIAAVMGDWWLAGW